MLNKIFNRQSRLEHSDPSERIQALADEGVAPDDVARLLKGDASPDVRKAAASRCESMPALAEAATSDADADVRTVAGQQLGALLATSDDIDETSRWLADRTLPDAIRIETARLTERTERRTAALDAITDEASLVALALDAPRTDTRMAAAERIKSEKALQQLHDVARNRDHGVARHVRQRLDAMRNQSSQAAEANAVLDALEALADEPGPILTSVVELNRRWQALDLAGDSERTGRAERARQAIQARFDREQDQQRAKAQFERKLREWIDALAPMTLPPSAQIADLRTTLESLRDEARARNDATASASLARLDDAERRLVGWEAEHTALAGAEALVDEAERLAADTSIDDAQLPTRWQSLDRSTRTPELTRRFEAALTTVETRRLAQVQATTQQATAAKQHLHGLLHTAEQALAAGTLQAARTALDEARTVKPAAGLLPKPTVQRLSRAIQQLSELERWESFGQQNARMQLVERAEALAAQMAEGKGDLSQVAQDVQKLRNEWKALDEQYKGVPKALWERFDHACERAYAPAARHFAEVAQQRKEARKKREDYIAQAAAHAPTLITETPDWKAIERWVREIETGWREGGLGSVDPGTWKKLETKLKDAVAPARNAMAGARAQVKAGREALIAEVNALLPRALERDTPSQVKAIQQRWQENARQIPLAQRDERTLWEQFRSACDAVFTARQAKRSEEDNRKSEGRRGLEALAADLEQLAKSTDPEPDVRRAMRDIQEKWRAATASNDPAVREVEGRFRRAKTAIDDLLGERSRTRESAVWQTLDAKERACEALDRALLEGNDPTPAAAAVARADEEWARLPALAPAWEKLMVQRRDAAKKAIEDAAAADKVRATMTRTSAERRAILLELELTLGLDSPRELNTERLALQVRQLKERFQSSVTASVETTGERYAQWCAMHGAVDAAERTRCEKIVAALGSARGRAAPKGDDEAAALAARFSSQREGRDQRGGGRDGRGHDPRNPRNPSNPADQRRDAPRTRR